MSNDLSKEALMEKISAMSPDQFYRLIIDVCTVYLEKRPTIEPQVVQGRWIVSASDNPCIDVAKCSACGIEMTERNQFWKSKFCPSCGTRMDAGGEST